MSPGLIALKVRSMRIVEYRGIPVKRQYWVARGIKVVFYDRAPIVISPSDWAKNHTNKFFDDPSVKRSAVVRAPKTRSIAGTFGRLLGSRV